MHRPCFLVRAPRGVARDASPVRARRGILLGPNRLDRKGPPGPQGAGTAVRARPRTRTGLWAPSITSSRAFLCGHCDLCGGSCSLSVVHLPGAGLEGPAPIRPRRCWLHSTDAGCGWGPLIRPASPRQAGGPSSNGRALPSAYLPAPLIPLKCFAAPGPCRLGPWARDGHASITACARSAPPRIRPFRSSVMTPPAHPSPWWCSGHAGGPRAPRKPCNPQQGPLHYPPAQH